MAKTTNVGAAVSLDRLTAADEARAGAKAFNCGRLKRAGFHVPEGVVVLANATDADVAMVADDPWFDQWPAEVRFAVRSSGIGEDGDGQSFAGIHQTFLDVPRADLADAVSRCRASGQAAQALDYRRAKGMSTDRIEMGVLIQRMIHPVTAGVAFSVNPVTGATGELVINASWGLGEALVSGQVDPDEFVVRKADGELLWTRLGDKGGDGQHSASLTVAQVGAIARILIDIERHYGAPQDIEWCHDGIDLWVVQSRPITSAGIQADETEWTRANIGEVLPDVTSPQVLAAFEDLLNQAERKFVGGLMAPESELGPMVKSFCGRLYFNLSQLRRVSAVGRRAGGRHAQVDGPRRGDSTERRGSAASDVVPAATAARHAADSAPASASRPHRRRASGEDAGTARPLVAGPAAAIVGRGSLVRHRAVVCRRARLHADRVALRQRAVSRGTGEEGLRQSRLPIRAAGVSAVGAGRPVGERTTGVRSRRPGGSRASRAARRGLSVRGSAGDLVNAGELRGTAFLGAFEQFLEKYGHRGLHEYDWSLPRFHEDPTPLLRAIRGHLEAGPATHAGASVTGQQRAAAEAMAAFERRLSTWQRWTTLRRVRGSIRKIKQVLRVARAGAIGPGPGDRGAAGLVSGTGRAFRRTRMAGHAR